MADDDTDPATPPARPRGAGWDDEDDWGHRDHGPRPHVPDHGRRPLLMALPIFLITLAAVVAILVAGCGDGDPKPQMGGAASDSADTPATTEASSSPEAVAKQISESAALFSGLADPDAFADTTCEAGDAEGEYRCAYGGEGDPDSGSITVRLQSDGSIGKVLGNETPEAGAPATDRVAELLVADDKASGQKAVTYACAASTAINPDGSSAGTSASGFRCALVDGTRPVGQRYVQFGSDGTAVRDFEVTEP